MVVFLTSAIALGIVFLYGCVGEILTEKAGHLNLGIPGVMSVGAAGGCLGISLYMGGLSDTANANYFLVLLSGVLMSALFSAALGAVYSFLTVSLRCNQNVTGLAITTFGVGMTMFLMESVIDRTYFAAASTYITRSLPFADNLGWFGEIFLSHGILVYLGIAVALISGWVLNRTRVGLHLRAVGENPAAADAVGTVFSDFPDVIQRALNAAGITEGSVMAQLQSGAEGLLYGKPLDAEALAQSLCAVLAAPDGGAALGQAARTRALRTHDPAANAETLAAIYKTILQEGAP